MFENTVLTKIFGAKREEVTSKWRTLRDEELQDLYSSPNIVCVFLYIVPTKCI